jgi:putative endonuclease
MVSNNKITGRKGEELALDYLLKKGYTLLDKNWQHHHLELDIVVKKNSVLVVVEVKTGNSSGFGEPQEWVNRRKQLRVIRAANAYVLHHNIYTETRFDIIAVLMGSGKPVITHIEDAFSAIG